MINFHSKSLHTYVYVHISIYLYINNHSVYICIQWCMSASTGHIKHWDKKALKCNLLNDDVDFPTRTSQRTHKASKVHLLNQSVESKHCTGNRKSSHAKLPSLTITKLHVCLNAWSSSWLSVHLKRQKDIDIDKPAHVRWAAACLKWCIQ